MKRKMGKQLIFALSLQKIGDERGSLHNKGILDLKRNQVVDPKSF
jgi:hypothetical protein